MINPGEFKIYNASAGSGKTFTLVRNIIILLLKSKKDNWFEYILAITFTNKAANEMKERILKNLKELADPHKKNDKYLIDLSKELGIQSDIIQDKAHKILVNILHNYSKFSISTIDKFNLRLIKSFAQDLGLAMNFDVEIDSKELIEQAVNLLYAKIGENEQLTNTIIDIALENMNEDRSWDVRKSLTESANQLSNDVHLEHIQNLAEFSLTDFNLYRKQIIANFRKTINNYQNIFDEYQQLMQTNGLTIADLHGKSRSIGSLFAKFNQYDGKKIIEPTATNSKDIIEENFLTKNHAALQLFDDFKRLYLEVLKLNQDYILSKALIKNINAISLLNEIKKSLEEIKSENNTLLINEFNALISKNLQDQPIPFIYEKIGSKYKHYFIDEFQDTSILQWDNLRPLIENAHSQEDTIMLVGDVKQSIYRWRGGNPNQMIDLIDDWPDLILENLETNWRSYENIITFNNWLYEFFGRNLTWEKYREIYEISSQQKLNHKKNGYVNVRFLEKDEALTFEEKNLDSIDEIISNALKNNFSLNEIAILVRTNAQGILVAEYLAEKKYPIISNDSLLLKNSPEILFLESILKVANQPKDKQNIAKGILLAHQIGLIKPEDFTETIQESIKNPLVSFIKTYQNFGFDLKFIQDENRSLYDFIEELIRVFPFEKSADAYLYAFLDEVLDFCSKNESNIQSFLEHWKTKRERLSIQTPKGIDAIQIMTIHKSKGLEFPVVILPFVNYQVKTNSNIWIPLEKTEDQPFDSFYVTVTKDLKNLENDAIKNSVVIEENLNQLDTFNTFYVATTRAVEQLYILAEMPPEKHNLNKVNQLLYDFLKSKNLVNDELNIDVLGENKRFSTKEKDAEKVKEIPFFSNDWTNNLIISTNSEKNQKTKDLTAFANGVHEILSEIKSFDDIQTAIDKGKLNGIIRSEDENDLIKIVTNVTEHPLLKKYFDKNLVILNERDFIDQDGQFFRADRVVIDEKKLSIIDYKTGNQDLKHHAQIDHYANFFRNLGYEIEHKILIYIANESQKLEIVEVN